MAPVAQPDDLDDADRLAVLECQTRILELIATGTGLHEILDGIAAALEGLIDGCHCSVLLLDPVTSTLHYGAAPSLPRAYSQSIDGVMIGPDVGSCGTAVYWGTPVIAEDIETDPHWDRYRHLARPYGLRSCWATPIRARNGVVGTFTVYRHHPHQPRIREQRLVEQFTHLASIAIDHSAVHQALRDSEERFRRAFEDNAVGMALATTEGQVILVNRTLQEILGRSESELLDGRLQDIFTPLTPDITTAELLERRLAGDNTVSPFEARGIRSDGTAVVIRGIVSVVRAAAGGPSQLCLNLADVTERRAAQRAEAALREAEVARSAAEAASRAKSALVATLSHEVRTPLQAITGFTELLASLDMPVDRRLAALGHIQAASEHILWLVGDVLDVARLEAGGPPVDIEDVEVTTVTTEVIDMLQPLAADRKISLGQDPSGVSVRADRRRLRQALINLVTNGVRYNQAAGLVQVSALREGSRVVITVRDSGRGIPPERLQRLFVPFDRLDAEDGPEPGVGLGLVLARGLIEAMDGQLEVDSVVNEGTSVRFSLPAADPPREPAA
ncbi:MAG: ATP-binding protein [Acidimicrobiales bacterium]